MIKVLNTEINNTPVTLDKTSLTLISLYGVQVKESELSSTLAELFNCKVTMITYGGVLVTEPSTEWTLWDKIKFLFN